MNFSSILIITYGRSGSTLLQGILNSISGCLIRGENDNLCYGLYQSYNSILESKKRHDQYPKDAWFGSHLLNDKLFISNCKNLVYLLLLADQAHNQNVYCYGFKEIRYDIEHIPSNLEDYLNFLNRIFPKPLFLFNTRKLEDVAKSEWWRDKQLNDTISILTKTESAFNKFMTQNPQKTFAITYEDLVNKTSRLKDLFDFIGADYDQDKIDRVLSIQHSYKTTK